MDTKMGPFGGHFETHFKAIRNLGSLGPPWLHLGPPWLHFGVILGSFLRSIFVILDAVLRTFPVCFCVSTGPLNDSDLCWNTPMVSEDTTFYEYSLQNHYVEYSTDTATCSRNTLVRLQQYSQDIFILSSTRHTAGIIEDLLCF